MVEADNTPSIISIFVGASIRTIGDEHPICVGAMIANDERAMCNRP